MFAVYFKKILFTAVWTIVFGVFFGIEYLVVTKFFFSLEGKLLLQYALILLALMLTLLIVLIARVKNFNKKDEYLSEMKDKYSLKKDLLYILKSKEFISEILATLTVCIPLFLWTGFKSGTSFLPFVFATFVLSVVSLLLMIIFDIPIWIIVHNRWIKEGY